MGSSSKQGLTIVISGSFRKYYDEIRVVIKQFEDIGVQVLSPKHSSIVNQGDEFVLLETDGTDSPENLEREHLRALQRAHALYLCNPSGYSGLSCAMEVGWALAFGKPIFSSHECTDACLRYFTGRVATPADVKADLLKETPDIDKILGPCSSLEALQSYIRQVSAERGFDSESPRDKVLLMLEEFGELAKAVRRYVGLKIDASKREYYNDVRLEMADILIYLLDLANACGVDLLDAFREKEKENALRRWTVK